MHFWNIFFFPIIYTQLNTEEGRRCRSSFEPSVLNSILFQGYALIQNKKTVSVVLVQKSLLVQYQLICVSMQPRYLFISFPLVEISKDLSIHYRFYLVEYQGRIAVSLQFFGDESFMELLFTAISVGYTFFNLEFQFMIDKEPKGVQIELTNIQTKVKTQNTNNPVISQNAVQQKEQMKQNQKEEDFQKKSIKRVKSKTRKIMIGLIISLSAVMFGYSLKEITSVPISILVLQFSITMSPSSAQSILIGVLPLGSVFGAILTKPLIKKYKRLTGIYIFTMFNMIAVVLINITIFGTLLAGRFLEGICVGYYSAIAPIYLREIAPKQLRKLLGLFFSLGKILGVLIVIVIELILEAAKVQYGWRIILSLTGLFSVLQAILIFFFGSDTPTEMIEKGKSQEALEIIKKFYKQKYVEEVYIEYTEQYEAEVGKNKQTMSENLNEEKHKEKSYKYQVNLHKHQKAKKDQTELNLGAVFTEMDINETNKVGEHQSEAIYNQAKEQNAKKHKSIDVVHKDKNQIHNLAQKKKIAYVLGVHLNAIRHLIGGNAIITQGGLFIKTIDPELGHYTSLIINSVQFVFIIFGLAYLQKVMGKKPQFLLSIGLLIFLNFGLAVAMIFQQQLSCMFLMCLYMAVYGSAFISPIWSYPSEIVPASQSLLPNIVHWVALAISTLIPPLVTAALPHNNSYPVFVFFGAYGIVGFLHVKFKLRESDGFTYNQILASFK